MDGQRRLDAVDRKIIALFEQRMALVKKAAQDVTRSELKGQRRSRGTDATDKAVRHSCDVDVIAYTESLIYLMLCAAEKYQKALRRIERRKKPRQLLFRQS